MKFRGIIAVMVLCSVFLLAGENNKADAERGFDKFIQFVKANKAHFGYEKYAITNQSGQIVVKITVPKEKQQNLVDVVNRYGVDKTHIEMVADTLVAFTVVFQAEPGAEASPAELDCPKKVNVRAYAIEPQTFLQYKYYQKTVLPGNEMEVFNEVPGTIKEVIKAEGDDVAEGEVIATLDDEAINQEIADAEKEIKKWKKILFNRSHWKVRSEKAEKQAERKIKEAEETLTQKKAVLQDYQIKAVMSGTVKELSVKAGDSLEAGASVARIVNTDKMKIDIAEAMNLVKNGESIQIKVSGMEENLIGIINKVDGGCTILIDNPDQSLKTGMTGDFKILEKSHQDVLVLNTSLIQNDDDGSFVFIVNPEKSKRATKVYIEKGIEDGGRCIITKGLSAGNEIIITGNNCLTDNKKIRLMEIHPQTLELVSRKKARKITGKKPVKKPAEKPVKPEKPKVVKKKEPKPKKETAPVIYKKFNAGINYSFLTISDSNFKNIYGSSLSSFGFNLSYNFWNKFDILLSLSFGASATSDFEMDGQLLEFSLKSAIAFDLRYHFLRKNKYSIFAGAGITSYSIEDDNPIEVVSETLSGFNFLIGGNYRIYKNLFAQLMYRFTSASKEKDEWDRKLDLSGGEVFIGFTYGF